MFSSSSNGISPFSQVSPYLNWINPSSSPSLNNHENPPLLSHHEDLLSLYFSNVAPTIDTSSNSKSIKNPEMISHCKTTKTKKTKKTDRHSKIFTAQGPRDRRVRLSIDISKKFFGLQDLLGFDKASLTLDWLLTKSKTAIGELLRANNIDVSKDTCLCSLPEEGQEAAEADDNSVVGSKETTTTSKRKGKSTRARNRKPQMMTVLDRAAKESREKARERARERTRVKVSLRNILGASQEQSLYSPTNNYQWPGQIWSSKSTDSSRPSTLTSSNEHSATPTTNPVEGFFFVNPVEGFFFVNPGTGEVNNHHQEDAFSESATFKTKNKLDFNLWRSSMNHDDLF